FSEARASGRGTASAGNCQIYSYRRHGPDGRESLIFGPLHSARQRRTARVQSRVAVSSNAKRGGGRKCSQLFSIRRAGGRANGRAGNEGQLFSIERAAVGGHECADLASQLFSGSRGGLAACQLTQAASVNSISFVAFV